MRAAALLILAVTGCSSAAGGSAFKVKSDREARAVVEAFLDAAVAGDAAKVAAHACEGREQAEAAVAGPLQITGYAIDHVEPGWVGAEPYFRVDVTLKKTAAHDARSLSVRAREGCIDRLLGEPVGAARPASGEISL